MNLFVPIMAISGEYEHYNFCVVDLVNKPMLLGYTSAPLSRSVSTELFGLASSSAGMNGKFIQQNQSFPKCFRFALMKLDQILIRLIGVSYLKSHNHIFSAYPSLIRLAIG